LQSVGDLRSGEGRGPETAPQRGSGEGRGPETTPQRANFNGTARNYLGGSIQTRVT